MSKTSNQVKTELLGIPWGTANNRMKKMLIWHLVKQLELDQCYRCENEIETIEELSIEHKEAWQQADDPSAVFFDMENITFSHLFCNSGAARRERENCSYGHPWTEENTLWHKDGYRRCRTCRKDEHKQYYVPKN